MDGWMDGWINRWTDGIIKKRRDGETERRRSGTKLVPAERKFQFIPDVDLQLREVGKLKLNTSSRKPRPSLLESKCSTGMSDMDSGSSVEMWRRIVNAPQVNSFHMFPAVTVCAPDSLKVHKQEEAVF